MHIFIPYWYLPWNWIVVKQKCVPCVSSKRLSVATQFDFESCCRAASAQPHHSLCRCRWEMGSITPQKYTTPLLLTRASLELLFFSAFESSRPLWLPFARATTFATQVTASSRSKLVLFLSSSSGTSPCSFSFIRSSNWWTFLAKTQISTCPFQ